jgi:hypothetical protein
MTTRRSTRPESDLPGWLPALVKEIAQRLPPNDIVTRLLSDVRMKSVWSYLARHDADSDAVLAMTLYNERMPPPDSSASLSDRSSAAFFLAIVDDLMHETTVVKRVDVDAQAQGFFEAAKLCRETIADAEGLTNGFFEAGEALNFDLAEALGVIAVIFERRGKRIRADRPNIIERSSRSRGDDALRIMARKIATTFFRFYGSHNYGLTAIIMSSATGANVSKKFVENALSKKSPI